MKGSMTTTAGAFLLLIAVASATDKYVLQKELDIANTEDILKRKAHGCHGGNIGEPCPDKVDGKFFCLDGKKMMEMDSVDAVDPNAATDGGAANRGRRMLGEVARRLEGPDFKGNCEKPICSMSPMGVDVWYERDANGKLVGWDGGTAEIAAGFYCRMDPALSTSDCADFLPADGEWTCLTIKDHAMMKLAGYGCDTYIEAIVNSIADQYPEVQKMIDENNKDGELDQLFALTYGDFCMKTCELCGKKTTMTVTIDDPDMSDDEAQGVAKVFRGELCVLYGFIKPGATAEEGVFDIEADFEKCPFGQSETTVSAGRALSAAERADGVRMMGRILGTATISLEAPREVMNMVDADLMDPKSPINSAGEAMGMKAAGGAQNFTSNVSRPGNDGDGLGLMGVIYLAVLAALCIICCPLCCCCYCCCCRSKEKN